MAGLQVTITPIQYEDIPAVIQINRACLPENYPFSYFEYLVNNWPEICLVAKIDGKIVGYILTRVEGGFSAFSPIRWRKKGHIISIAVLPEYRNKGIGSNLIKAVIDKLKSLYNASEVILEVRVSNPAQFLYERLGFKKVKVLRHYYSDGEDAYLMALQL